MNFKTLLTTALLSTLSIAAQGRHSDFPKGAPRVGNTELVTISDLGVYDHGLIDRLMMRSNLNDLETQSQAQVIATVRGGEVVKFGNYPKMKTLSDETVSFLATSGSCDLDKVGPCLVYSKQGGDGHTIVIGTRNNRGETQVVQGAFLYDLHGSGSLAGLTERLKNKSNAKYVVFTNADAPTADDGPIMETSSRGARSRRAQ